VGWDEQDELAIEPPNRSRKDVLSEEGGREELVLSTMHSARGLEWKVVFIIQARDGSIPLRSSFDDLEPDQDKIDEELRLFYVAVTRAKDRLVMVWPRSTARGYWDDWGMESSFIQVMPEEFLDRRQASVLLRGRDPHDVARELLGAPAQARSSLGPPVKSKSPRSARKKIASGTRVPVKLDAEERALILEHTLADPDIIGSIEEVKPEAGTVEIHYALDDIDELLGSIAAEANHTKNTKLRKKLDRLFDRLKAEMASYDDGEWQEPF